VRKKMMKRLTIGLTLLGGVYLFSSGLFGSAPDKQIAKHFEGLCGIAKKNIKSPHQGVLELSAYLGKHSPTMMRHFGDLLVEIERIEDDSKHDQRALEAGRVMRKPLEKCSDTLERFFGAVESDPEARRALEHRLTRLNRTLELLFGGQSSRSSLQRLTRLLPR
jgi:hypothetical protein